MRRRPSGEHGVTLIELMIVMGILIVLVCLLAAIWSSAYSIFRRGTSRMAVTQQAREVVRRVTPLIMCAKAQNELSEAVLTPEIDEEDVKVDFTTADNILVPIQSVDGRNPTHYRFEIYLAADHTVRVRQLDLNSGAPTGAEKILAYKIEEIHFKRLAANLVDFHAITSDTIRNAVNAEEELKVERSAVIAIPYYSSTR